MQFSAHVFTIVSIHLLNHSYCPSPGQSHLHCCHRGHLSWQAGNEVLASGVLALERKEKRRKAGGKEGRKVGIKITTTTPPVSQPD